MGGNHQERLFNIVSKTFEIPVDDISLEMAAGSIPQWDSLGHLGLVSAIEEDFGISFDVDELFEVETLGDFLDLLEKQDI